LLEKKQQKQMLHKYIECRLKFSGLNLPQDVRALLEHCRTEDEVERAIKRFRKSMKEGLHFSSLDKIVVQETKKVDPRLSEIDKRVGLAFGA